MSVTINYY